VTFYFITKTYFGKNISVVVGMISEKSCDAENWRNDILKILRYSIFK